MIPMAHPGASQHLLAYDSGTGVVGMYEVTTSGGLNLKRIMQLGAGFDEVVYTDYLDSWSSYVLFYDKESGNTQVAFVDYLEDEVLVREDVHLSRGIETMVPFLRGFVTYSQNLQAYPQAVCSGAPSLDETLDTFPVPQSDIDRYISDFDMSEGDWDDGFGYGEFHTHTWKPFARTIRGLYMLDKLSHVGVAELDRYDWSLEWLDHLAAECSGSSAVAGTQPSWGNEYITFYHDFFYEMYPVERAAVFVHEAAHTYDPPNHVDCFGLSNYCDASYGGDDPGALTTHLDYLTALYGLRNHSNPSSDIELTTLMYRRIANHRAAIAVRFRDNNPPGMYAAQDRTWE